MLEPSTHPRVGCCWRAAVSCAALLAFLMSSVAAWSATPEPPDRTSPALGAPVPGSAPVTVGLPQSPSTLVPNGPARGALRPSAVRLDSAAGALRINGRLDEPVWQTAPVHDTFVQYRPTNGQPVPVDYRTTVQVVIEPHALVFGIRAFDPQPEDIRAPLIRRDEVKRDQDFVLVVLDPVGTRRSAQFVRVNAAGVVADGMYIADTDVEDFAPDFEFEAASHRTPDGYSVEIRMPLLSLRYPFEGGAPWRMMVGRNVPRDVSRLFLSTPLSKDALNFIAELQEIDGLQDLAERVRNDVLVSVRPEITMRTTRRSDASGVTQQRHDLDLGAQIKWRPRADWVIDATLNPDFSQVELDVPQLAGNTRFALSVPEKRPFFLESTDVLDLPLAAFYSRAVTDPRWGLRATWRANDADATALSLRDDGGGLVLRPGPYGTDVAAQDRRSHATLLRGRMHPAGGDVSAGALFSSRDYGEGRRNDVVGADVLWRSSTSQQFRVRALGSQTSALFDAAGQPVRGAREDGHHGFASWWLRVPGWNFTAEMSRTSPRFRNDNGFVGQAGVRVLQGEVIRRFGEQALPGFIAHDFEFYAWAQQQDTVGDEARGVVGGETISRKFHPGVWLTASRNTEAWVHLMLDAARSATGGRLHQTPGLAGSYLVNPASWFPRLYLEVEWGERLDVEADRVGRGAMALLEVHLRGALANGWGIESQQRLQQSFVDAPDAGRALTETNARWLGVLHFSARDALRVVWQGSHLRRSADPGVGIAAAAGRSSTTSLVFQRRWGVGRSVSLGASRQRERPGSARAAEVFVKASFDLMD